MAHHSRKKLHTPHTSQAKRPVKSGWKRWQVPVLTLVILAALIFFLKPASPPSPQEGKNPQNSVAPPADLSTWPGRASAVSTLFHQVYTPCWEGAYGAIGDAYLFAQNADSTLLTFHLITHDMRKMCEGTWVDDAAWVCLAELTWFEVTGRKHMPLVMDASRRYDEMRAQGRLSSHEGFWAWYNWPPGGNVRERIFTNSNMNQMATVATGLYRATGDKRYLQEALLVWDGDSRTPGIERQWYRGNGVWRGRQGRAAFGKELPWDGMGCASLAAALFRATGDERFRTIAVATTRRVLDPANDWVDPTWYYQKRMDGNGAFVNFLFDAYAIAPLELKDVPRKIERMLEHVWTNHGGKASVVLHRGVDHGIRNGWNPDGGEDGYGVGEVGTVHAQGEAARAFGVFAWFTGTGQPAVTKDIK
jgi:hypothetical protein